MATNIRAHDNKIGYEIKNVDLSQQMDDDTLAIIVQAFEACGVVVIRNQQISPEQQISFSKRLGDLTRYMIDDYLLPGHPEIFVVSNIVENGRPIGLEDAGSQWHSDMCFAPNPPSGSLLYALEVPTLDGLAFGDTRFSSMQDAFDALPEPLQKKIVNLRVVNSYSRYAAQKKLMKMAKGSMQQDAPKFDVPPDIAQPLVRQHPKTGRNCLYLSEGLSVEIVGLPAEEGQALIQQLLTHATQPRFMYRHSWRPGDLVIWDNYSSIHKATVDYALPLRRLMYRTTLAGYGSL
jgi:taurine dioxygenase